MEFPCSFHLDNLFVLLMQGPACNLHGISMETPWKLHQNYIRVPDGTEEPSKRKHVEIAFVKNYIKPPSKIHGISMESA